MPFKETYIRFTFCSFWARTHIITEDIISRQPIYIAIKDGHNGSQKQQRWLKLPYKESYIRFTLCSFWARTHIITEDIISRQPMATPMARNVEHSLNIFHLLNQTLFNWKKIIKASFKQNKNDSKCLFLQLF